VNLNEDLSFVLRYGAMIGILIVAVGLAIDLIGIGYGKHVMTAGVAIIVLTPLAGIIVSFASLTANGERRYALSALSLVAIAVIGILIGYCFL